MNEPDDREPFPACDAFRLLEQVFTVDPRYASRSVLDPKVGARPMTIEDHWKYIATIALHEGVSSVIRVHFETARNLLLYSWFVTASNRSPRCTRSRPWNTRCECAAGFRWGSVGGPSDGCSTER